MPFRDQKLAAVHGIALRACRCGAPPKRGCIVLAVRENSAARVTHGFDPHDHMSCDDRGAQASRSSMPAQPARISRQSAPLHGRSATVAKTRIRVERHAAWTSRRSSVVRSTENNLSVLLEPCQLPRSGMGALQPRSSSPRRKPGASCCWSGLDRHPCTRRTAPQGMAGRAHTKSGRVSENVRDRRGQVLWCNGDALTRAVFQDACVISAVAVSTA